MKKVVVTDHEFDHYDEARAVAEHYGAHYIEANTQKECEVLEITKGADVVVAGYAPITAEVLGNLASRASVIRYGVGHETVDVEAATRLGVRVCNVPDYGSGTVADHTVALALTLLRRIPQYHSVITEPGHGWMLAREMGPVPALSDITYGLIGTGQIGSLVSERMQAFGSRIVACDPSANPAKLAERNIEVMELERLLSEADVISLHCPLTPRTHHLLDEPALRLTKPGVIVINTARGSLIDTYAAARLVNDGHLGALGLDVFESEPLEPDHPLRAAKNTVLTPHAAFYSTRSLMNMKRLSADEIARALNGQPFRHQLNPEVA
jgi:D-3-phosphoglycerate dehydrogenase / 2-oxoglutarate reductase